MRARPSVVFCRLFQILMASTLLPVIPNVIESSITIALLLAWEVYRYWHVWDQDRRIKRVQGVERRNIETILARVEAGEANSASALSAAD